MSYSVFQYSLLGTAAGIIGIISSYSLLGTSSISKNDILNSITNFMLIPMVLGSLVTAYGLIVAAKATETLSLGPMTYSGIIMISGLVLTHESYVRGYLQ